jgi:hypothetical protein
VPLERIVEFSLWMIIPVGIVGSVLHFLFDWTKHNRFVAVFAAVNESYWEHVKMAIWPVFLLQGILFGAGGFHYSSFVPAATIALYSIPISMVGLVFLYKAIFRRNILWLDISLFFVVIAIAQVLFALILEQLSADASLVGLSVLFLCGLVAAFARFTFKPPREPDVFIDPLNKKYGVKAHPDL